MIIRKWTLSSLFVIGLLLIAQPLFSQSKSQLKKKKAKIQKEIKKLNGLLGETRTNKRNSEIQLLILNKKIGARQDLISAIGNEVFYINEEISNQNNQIRLHHNPI